MPDVSQMSGVPLPTGDLPMGTVSVRVVRGDLTNNVANQIVELHGGPGIQTATTDASGRARFDNQAPGATLHAVTIVDGQRLETQPFVVPDTGGVRVMLVAQVGAQAAAPGSDGRGGLPPGHPVGGARDSRAPAGPPEPGTVVFGGQTRVVVEVADEALDIYYLLEVANAAQHPVRTDPIVVEPPSGARGLSVMEGSSPQAKVEGHRLTVNGPFQPGVTAVQLAYQLPYGSGTVHLRQTLPLALAQTSLIVRKFGDMHFTSPQAGNHREMTADGNTYIVASGGGLASGSDLEMEITGLPHRSSWPRDVALMLALGIIAGGAWLSIGSARAPAEQRQKKLGMRREQALNDLVQLEEQHLTRRGDEARYAARRSALLEQLDQVYGELENAGTVLDQSATREPSVTRARVTA
jgi:hypothetical protein